MRKRTAVFFSVLCILCLCAGCAGSDAELESASGIVVLDYRAEGAPPSVRLSVFAQTASDARRAESLKIASEATGFEWAADEPLVMEADKSRFVYYPDFVTAAPEKIPAGAYRLDYTDAEGNCVQSLFSVSYPEELADSDAAAAETFFQGRAEERLAVYDGNGVLLYFGERTDAPGGGSGGGGAAGRKKAATEDGAGNRGAENGADGRDTGGAAENGVPSDPVFAEYGDAEYYRRCLVSADGAVLCLMPPVTRPEN